MLSSYTLFDCFPQFDTPHLHWSSTILPNTVQETHLGDQTKTKIASVNARKMGFSATLKKLKSSFSRAKTLTRSDGSPQHTRSEGDLVSMQLPLPRYSTPPQSHSEAALHRPTSQIVCHSPLDKRNRAGKGKSGRSKDDQGGREGSRDTRRYTTTTRVLFSSTQFDTVDVKNSA